MPSVWIGVTLTVRSIAIAPRKQAIRQAGACVRRIART